MHTVHIWFCSWGVPRYVLLRYPKFVTRVRSSNFDRCHSFLLALSAAGSARKRPHFESLWYDAPVCIIFMEPHSMWLGVAESTSHSQLEGRGACSPDAELANHRHRRYISPWCILYIFDFVLEGCPVMSCCGTPNLSLAFARQILTAATPFFIWASKQNRMVL